MNTQLIENAIDAFEGFAASLGNDVCNNNENGEYVVFNGQIAADNQGNIKTYALVNTADAEAEEPRKVLVAQAPLRTILHKGAEFFKSLVYLYKADEEERKAAAEAEAKAQAEADETENQKIDNQISDLNSQISDLKFRKKPVRRFVKKLSFED